MADGQKDLLENIERLLESKDTGGLRDLLADQRSSDIAEVVELLDNEERRDAHDG